MIANITLGTLFLLGILHLLGDAQHLSIPARRKIGAVFTAAWGFFAVLGFWISSAIVEVGAFFLLVSLVVLIAVHFGLLSRPPRTRREND